MLEENEKRILELSAAIREGEESGRYDDFDPEKHLKELKAAQANG